jgi:hypothetical protein
VPTFPRTRRSREEDVRGFLVAALLGLALAATPTAHGHAGRPHWTLAKLNRTAVSAIVIVKKTKYLAIFLSCRGEGRTVLRSGKRAWKHFACTAPLSRGPRDYGRARFRLHVLDYKDRFITSDGRFLP